MGDFVPTLAWFDEALVRWRSGRVGKIRQAGGWAREASVGELEIDGCISNFTKIRAT